MCGMERGWVFERVSWRIRDGIEHRGIHHSIAHATMLMDLTIQVKRQKSNRVMESQYNNKVEYGFITIFISGRALWETVCVQFMDFITHFCYVQLVPLRIGFVESLGCVHSTIMDKGSGYHGHVRMSICPLPLRRRIEKPKEGIVPSPLLGLMPEMKECSSLEFGSARVPDVL
jgi:hypothetical protein